MFRSTGGAARLRRTQALARLHRGAAETRPLRAAVRPRFCGGSSDAAESSDGGGEHGYKSIRDLMAVASKDHDVHWLRQALQFAIQLELFTIPPYLTAMWSIKQDAHRGQVVRANIAEIAQMEMIHMGLACNLLTAIDGTPRFANANACPKYPSELPGNVHPGLIVRLYPLSKCLVEHVFMEIEKPDFEPLAYYDGEMYPTIGAFYNAIMDAFAALDAKEISGDRQLEYDKNDVITLTKVTSKRDAIRAITRIKEQGEGTESSPYFGPPGTGMAHYYRFGEIFCGRQLARDCLGNWSYTGKPLEFPGPDDIYPMAPIPPGGYEESEDFDDAYSALLRKLQAAWEIGSPDGQTLLDQAVIDMTSLYDLAKPLFEKELPDTPGWTYGPSFVFRN